jgi:hypothetical protein
MRTAAVLLFLFLQAPANPAQQAPKASIEGSVLRSGTGEPVERARLALQRILSPQTAAGGVVVSVTPPPQILPIQTEKDGKFTFKDLEPGQYRLRVQRNGYAPQEYGQRTATGPGTVITLAEGQQLKDIAFRLTAAAILTGRIRDTNGEPVPALPVSLMRTVYNVNGQRSLQAVGNATTDDRGEYRIYWVPPGRYILGTGSSNVNSGIDALLMARGGQNVFADRVFPPTFYPGTLDASRASVIDLQAGSELTGIDMVLTQPAGFRVRGRVVDATTGKPPQNGSVSIGPRQVSGASGIVVAGGSSSSNVVHNNATGTFEIRNVIPGSYWLRASSYSDMTETVNLNISGTARNAMEVLDSMMMNNNRSTQAPIDMIGSDIEGVVLTLTAGLTIPLRLQFEGQELSSVTGLENVRVNLRATTPGVPVPYQAISFNTEGAASLPGVSPGEYRVQSFPPSPEMYLKEVLFERVDVLNRPWEVTSQSSGTLTIVFSNKGGLVEGVLTDVLSQPVRGNQVVLIPDQGRDRSELYKTALSDQNGRFTFRGIAPGGYRVYAWEAIEANAWYDRDLLSQYEALGKPVRIQESSKETVDLKIIPAPK